MARDKHRFKTLVNAMLERLEDVAPGPFALSERVLAEELDASRTSIRAVLAHLVSSGLLQWDARSKRVLRRPRAEDYFAQEETRRIGADVEEQFLEWVLHGDLPPGTAINEAELARRFSAPVAAVREFLIRFEPLGLIEKRPNRSWILKGFTREFAEEMFVVREMFERLALPAMFAACQQASAERDALVAIAAEHLKLRDLADDAGLDAFPPLDAKFHRFLCSAAGNRFILEFTRTISIIVHYHYRWNKRDEHHRNREALQEHLDIIDAVLAGDADGAARALDRHLATAYRTLTASVSWNAETP